MKVDFCIIGGGIAGLSIASELARHADVLVLEREADPAFHTTGRSAALYSELTAQSTALALSRLSRPFLLKPPAGFCDHPLHNIIGCIFTASDDEAGHIQTLAAKLECAEVLDIDQMLARVPVLRTGEQHITSGLLEKEAFRIDVGALVQAYRRQIRRNGATLRCGAEVMGLMREKEAWWVALADGDSVSARRIVNAAGAWGDVIATRANVAALGLSPLRRTMIVFDGPPALDCSQWPAVGSITGAYYFLPEAGRLMGSSADEVASPPCDAQPEEYDIALAAHNIESATTLEIRQIRHKWAGLRTFAPDRQVVAGYAGDSPGFFWFVGQGGFGIQTAPAAARAAALLAMEEPLPPAYEHAGVTAATLSPQRFTTL